MFLKISFFIALAFSDLIGYNRLGNNVKLFQKLRNLKIEWHSPGYVLLRQANASLNDITLRSVNID